MTSSFSAQRSRPSRTMGRAAIFAGNAERFYGF